MPALFVNTIRGLLAPKRFFPVLLLAAPLLWAQWVLSSEKEAAFVAVLMIGTFWLLAPFVYRGLFHTGANAHWLLTAVRVVGYLFFSWGTIFLTGVVIPDALELGSTFLTYRSSLVIETALFAVGGFGLGRDVEHEELLRKEKERSQALVREAERAQLLALRSHLDPHFLFNTLNAIAEWCREDGEVAERATLELSSMLRVILVGVQEESWPLKDELALCDSFFSLHRIRDPERFQVETELLEPCPNILVPPMMLLPVVENAVKHGPAAGHKGSIRMLMKREGTRLKVSVENPGPYTGPRAGGEGLNIVEKRLRLAYGTEATFRIGNCDTGTRAEILLPFLESPRMSTAK